MLFHTLIAETTGSRNSRVNKLCHQRGFPGTDSKFGSKEVCWLQLLGKVRKVQGNQEINPINSKSNGLLEKKKQNDFYAQKGGQ